jgi:pimeloyl-ACP methyl ester carboxylesterase
MDKVSVTRRRMVAGAAAAALGAPASMARAASASKTFVLVHGASQGGWCWRRVSDRLERRGHKVFTPTLTGLGERSHLMSRSVDLDMHITDVVNVIRWESLEGIVLVGHSYGGWVISGVAEQALSAISSIVFLDAFMPENGQKGLDLEREREGPRLGGREADRAADRRLAAADQAHGRARPRRQESLPPRDSVREPELRSLLRQEQGGPVLAHV